MSFGDFYRRIGFEEYPFGAFTSESEKNQQKDLFVDTTLYSPIVERFSSGNTLILSGDRGTGKAAILYDFMRRVNQRVSLLVQISDFSSLAFPYDSKQLYIFLTRQLSDALFSAISDRKISGKNLSKSERITLSYYYARYTHQTTKNNLAEALERLQLRPLTRLGRGLYKVTRHILNIGANGAVHFMGDLIARSVGAGATDPKWNEYFPELGVSVESDFADADGSFASFCRLISLTKKLGFDRTIIILDKIDEDPRFGNAAEEISEFIEPMLTDNKLLLEDQFQLVIMLWLIPLNMIRDAVRTQKLNCPVIQWSLEDLRSALERRLSVFSNGKISKLNNFFDDEATKEQIDSALNLSNRNPRDLWHVFDSIMRAQYKINETATRLSAAAVADGLNDFVQNFNFYEYYPRKSNARANSLDIYAYIKHLLKLDSREFTRNRLNERAGTGSSTPNYIVAMQNMGLIEPAGSVGGMASYTIRDPKVVYAIENNIDIARNIQ